jgi:drug/metabolite transporter (DMT)-like permease
MAALLALTAAAAYGAGDFLGGIATRRAPATAVVLWSHIVGFGLLLAAAPLVGGVPDPRALAVGAGAGLIGAAGVTLLYQALSLGNMSVVAPVAALLSAVVPVVAGIGSGERPTTAAVGGIGLALVAITLVSRENPDRAEPSAARRALPLMLALAAGLAFGLFFVAVDLAGTNVGIWPLVAARAASITAFSSLSLVGLTAASRPRAAIGPAIGAGVLDASANVCYLLALSHGLLSVVAVLTALYPIGTVVLARYLLGERMTSSQHAGLGCAALAAVLVAA